MIQILNEDLRRARKSVIAYSVYAEKQSASGHEQRAKAIALRGDLEAEYAGKLVQLIRDLGGADEADVDRLNAILNADRVASPGWNVETERRLHDRARQLRTAGYPGYAKRLARILHEKRRMPDLSRLIA
jgi:hypothetical protein